MLDFLSVGLFVLNGWFHYIIKTEKYNIFFEKYLVFYEAVVYYMYGV